MKVLQIGKFYPPHRGGMESALYDLCDELKDKVDLRVLVANGRKSTITEVKDGVNVTRVGSVGMIFSTSICPTMPYWMMKCPADIVQIHHPNPMANISFLFSNHPGKLIVLYQSDIVRQRMSYAVYAPFLMRMLQRAHRIIVTSPNYLASSPLLARFKGKCVLIPLGIDLRRFEPKGNEGKIASIRSQYGDRIILFVGRLTHYKGVPYLLEAMKRVSGRLLIIGGGDLEEQLRNQGACSGLSTKVCFLGELEEDEIFPFFHACDLLVLPSISRNEAFGLVQLEAMACYKPVVSTDLQTGVPYVNRNGVTGFVVPPKDPRALAEAINRLLEDEGLKVRMGIEGRRRVEKEFTREKMAGETLKLYEEVLRS
jgi:glycosyltransferase involved in cell wall biosynthesis